MYNMSGVTYIITVPSERLLGLSGKTSYDASGKLINPEKVTQEGKEDQDSSDSDDEDEEELIEDDVSDRDGLDEFEEFQWMKSMYGEATIPDDTSDKKSKRIANCVSKLIHRDEIRRNFHADMEEPSHDTSSLAFDLFDRYGRLKRELIEHPVKKGSGVWGEELDTGDFLLVELLTVEKDHQRQGIATKLANVVREKSQEICQPVPFCFVWATHYQTTEYRIEVAGLSEKERKASYDRSQARAVAFWRSLGYRRVGSTHWLCRAADLNHPSHKLTATDDWDPPVHEVTAEDGRELKDIYPIHYKIDFSNDATAASFLQQRLVSFPASDPSWRKVDRDGKSIVHYAAECSKSLTLRWMLKQPFGVELSSCRNYAGETPLEALETVLEADRVKRRIQARYFPVSDQFEGHQVESIACLMLLRGMSNTSDLDIRRFGYGCTCGECIGGFMSPRTTFALLCQAGILHDQLNADVAELPGPLRCEGKDRYFKLMRPYVRANLFTNKSLRQGFTDLFAYIASCLRSKQALTTENVLAALGPPSGWPRCTKDFLQRGGSVASAILLVFDFAMDQDEMVGNGGHQDVFREDIEKLKECRNDHEWGFVRRLCGFAEKRECSELDVEAGIELGMGGPTVTGKRTREEEPGDRVGGVSKRVA